MNCHSRDWVRPDAGATPAALKSRRREIGVRSAPGASRSDLIGVVLRQGLLLTDVGVRFVDAAEANALATLPFGVSRLDPPTCARVVALLTVVSALACTVLCTFLTRRLNPTICR
jgi:putative ABC transport system permease protein